ncbi:cilia- and flagella-associated protein 97 isoform X2 [Triplophysa dalaica]|uniref:cilia- and flagella-associated protein 97 isoform X2 n=1 Tax=Triplophysa dalaica TaxID=1582913 RepID=UPI0024DF9265|nr:cilia- and flagella-associated protein 97 isoform X2 [Triplophysa dalaica]
MTTRSEDTPDMYSPKEPEGEVDHSFFDTDCEANVTVDEPLNKQEASKGPDERKNKETNVLMDQIGSEVQSGRHERPKASLENGLHQAHDENKECDKGVMKEVQSSNALFTGSSPIPCAKNSETGDNSQSDEGSSVQSYSSDEDRELDDEDCADFKLRKNSNSDDDGYHRSNDESEEEESQSSKQRGSSHGTPKKRAGKYLQQSHSSSSDTESSHSGEERSSFCSQKSPVKHYRVASANQREKAKESAESEDTVTDVTPLSTPNVSPFQSIDIVLPYEPLAVDAEKTVVNEEISDGSISSEGEDEPALSKIEKQLERGLVSSPSSVASSRKNYSFTNEEVRQIDRENQRLLRELSGSSACSRSGSSTFSSASSRKNNAPPTRLYHSAVNRQKEQERIQKENLAFLRRLESVKATPGLTRNEQLADHQRQCRYLGTHSPGRSSRPCSSPHKDRPGTAKLNRATPRPAWS